MYINIPNPNDHQYTNMLITSILQHTTSISGAAQHRFMSASRAACRACKDASSTRALSKR